MTKQPPAEVLDYLAALTNEEFTHVSVIARSVPTPNDLRIQAAARSAAERLTGYRFTKETS